MTHCPGKSDLQKLKLPVVYSFLNDFHCAAIAISTKFSIRRIIVSLRSTPTINLTTMLVIYVLLLALSTPLYSGAAALKPSSDASCTSKRRDTHNFSVNSKPSVNRFGHAMFCSNVDNIKHTNESHFEVDDCVKLFDGLAGPIGYYNYWFSVNDLDCSQCDDPRWIPVVGKQSCNFAVLIPGCPDGGIA